jgi:hypothetical protein
VSIIDDLLRKKEKSTLSEKLPKNDHFRSKNNKN